MRDIQEIRDEINERLKWSLADENRDSRKLFALLDQLAEHVQLLSQQEKHP